MRATALSQRNTPALLNRADVLEKWKRLHEAAPTTRTPEALALLQETANAVRQSPEDAKDRPEQDSRSSLLSARTSSLLIWKTLRRQRVPWDAALVLAAAQLSSVPPAQKEFIVRHARGRPWQFSRAVLASWDMQDPSLTAVYRALRRCTTIVAMSQDVSVALRSRPELNQVLPVPASVLRHCYALGLAGEGNNAASLALELNQHLSLAAAEGVTLSEKESLALGLARLHGRTGNWATALQLVTSSGVVRLTEKTNFSAYVRHREMYREGARLKPNVVPTAVMHAPSWEEALRLVHAQEGEAVDDAKLAFLSRADVSPSGGSGVLSKPGGGLPWQIQLDLFRSVSARKQTFRALRPILEQIPVTSPDYIVVCAEALRPVASRMFVGTLTRRLHALEKKNQVAAAVALACSAGYYDVAEVLSRQLSPLVVAVPPSCSSSGGGGNASDDTATMATEVQCFYQLPADLLLFSKVANKLKQPAGDVEDAHNSTGGSTVRPREGTSPHATGEVVNLGLSGNPTLPELLAHGLYGNWQAAAALCKQATTADTANPASNSRLRSLLLAKKWEAAGEPASEFADGEVHCASFASAAVSQMVCKWAPEKDRRYFAKVIPRALHAHHFGTLPASESATTSGDEGRTSVAVDPQRRAIVTESGGGFLHFLRASPSSKCSVETVEDCHWLLYEIVEHLRSSKGMRATGIDLLKAVARACATGCVRLRTAESFGLTLAVLKASHLMAGDSPACRCDALVATVAVQSTPSQSLDECAAAVATGVNALLLSGNVRVVSAVYSRWAEKQRTLPEEVPAAARRLNSPGSHANYESGGRAQGGDAHLADVFLRAAYYMPRAAAQRWSTRIWHDFHRPNAILMQELLVQDTRQVADLLRGGRPDHGRGDRVRRANGTGGATVSSRQQQAAAATKTERALSRAERRRLLGMAFSLLDTTHALYFVLRAAGKQKVVATDVDEHGLRRLLRALPGTTALSAVLQLSERRDATETIEELWLLMVLCKHDHRSLVRVAEAVMALTLTTQSSSAFLLVNCHCVLLRALGDTDGSPANPLLALKAIARFTELTVTTYRSAAPVLYSVLSIMLKQFSDCPLVVSALLDSGESSASLTETHKLSRRVLNRLLAQRELEQLLRKERRGMSQLLKRPDPVSPVLLLGWLHHALSRHQRLPVAASFTSRLLRLAAEHTTDWMTAFHLFNCIHRPTNEERLLLLRALEKCPRDVSARMQHNLRFLQATPELVLVWAALGTNDNEATPSGVAFSARALLSQEVIRQTMASATSGEKMSEEATQEPFHLSPRTQDLVDRWTMKDCSRALGILRQLGWIKTEPPNAGGESKVLVVAGREEDAVLRAVLDAIERQQAALRQGADGK